MAKKAKKTASKSGTTDKPTAKRTKLTDRIDAAVAAGFAKLHPQPPAEPKPELKHDPIQFVPKQEPKVDPAKSLQSTAQEGNTSARHWIDSPSAAAALVAIAVLVVGVSTNWKFGLDSATVPPPAQQTTKAPAPAPAKAPALAEPTCPLPNTKYIAAVGGCVEHVTSVAEINKATPADTANDPNCKGKPVGHKYDTFVTGPDGRRGVAHHVCGVRPKS